MVLSALLTACVGGATPARDARAPASGEATVLVTSGVRYATAPPGWVDPTLDLYLPPDAGEPPLAVVLPDAGAEAGAPDYVELARALAARGVLVAVASWGVETPELRAVAGRPAEDLVAQTRQVTAEVTCALAAAAVRAGPGVGTPARPVVVVGHGAGANAAAMAILTTAPAFETCFVTAKAPSVAAASLWDGDWLGAVAEDSLGSDVAAFLAAYSPWPDVDSVRTSTFLEVGVNANRLEGQAVAVGPTSSYLTTRDPTASVTDDLTRVGAFDNGTIDAVDVTRGFSVGLEEAGVASRERELHGEGDPHSLGPRVRGLIVQSVVQLTTPEVGQR